ncbi:MULTISPECIES: helix-turn-helix domain-containing protein [unclassified Mesorhizobium]|jgi:DNA-binding transcriptional ArsR family regulator|uniref:ArsR/SmtB family transcription factor n=1 Tax=unclassified Mesorhizobium TaxID=325217 RepID=UPI0008E35411|nr:MULTISPECIES: helix-turn-helix domain-containing protein [unclassified Mesorhizobium]RJG46072.1 ArsR family transcriptional regulator [Mesorhizobium sp. DCY119]SFU01312.1 DNA-binding transcriptional regulator, ArsR family [Mesorhizobium sp. YR577]
MADSEGHPELDEIGIGPVLSALADPLRRRVVAELARAPEGTERTCASFGLPVTKATLTHHFRVLREAGLIRQINRGNSRTAALRRDDIDAKLPGLLSLVAANDIIPG